MKRYTSRFLVLHALLISFAFTPTASASTQEVQTAIDHAGKHWVAGDTSVSRLSRCARRKRLGLIRKKTRRSRNAPRAPSPPPSSGTNTGKGPHTSD